MKATFTIFLLVCGTLCGVSALVLLVVRVAMAGLLQAGSAGGELEAFDGLKPCIALIAVAMAFTACGLYVGRLQRR